MMIKIHLVHGHFHIRIFNIFKKSFQVDWSLYNHLTLFIKATRSGYITNSPWHTQAVHTYLYGEGIFGRLICNIKS